MAVRLERGTDSAIRIANWLREQPQVARVMCPLLPGDHSHELWQRDFTGGCGLFSFVLDTADEGACGRVVDALDLFGIGYSWGGFESLALPIFPQQHRGVMRPPNLADAGARAAIRLSIGLEDPDDLIADLAQALAKMDD